MAVFIEGRRSGYGVDSCGETMTVGELIAALSEFNEDDRVYLKNDGGYTYGNIDYDSFEDESVSESVSRKVWEEEES